MSPSGYHAAQPHFSQFAERVFRHASSGVSDALRLRRMSDECKVDAIVQTNLGLQFNVKDRRVRFGGAAEAAPFIPDFESALGAHPCVALYSAQPEVRGASERT
jgi:hypothetical protein